MPGSKQFAGFLISSVLQMQPFVRYHARSMGMLVDFSMCIDLSDMAWKDGGSGSHLSTIFSESNPVRSKTHGMKTSFIRVWLLISVLVFVACRATTQQSGNTEQHFNPLLSASPLPFQAPPFDKIRDGDFAPAFARALRRTSARKNIPPTRSDGPARMAQRSETDSSPFAVKQQESETYKPSANRSETAKIHACVGAI